MSQRVHGSVQQLEHETSHTLLEVTRKFHMEQIKIDIIDK
jgi:hypothetical protein